LANLNPEELRRLARLGAKTRLEQLRAEEDAIRAEFPDLFGVRHSAAKANGASDSAPRKRRSRRRRTTSTISAEARKAASERMLKYWAERRKAQAG
jgi:hypothetical protein